MGFYAAYPSIHSHIVSLMFCVIRSKPLEMENYIVVLCRQYSAIVLLLVSITCHAEHMKDKDNLADRPYSKQGAGSNCFESLSDRQLKLLSQIRQKIHNSADLSPEALHDFISQSNLPPSEKNALATLAFGEIISKARMEGFKTSAPKELAKLESMGVYSDGKLDLKNLNPARFQEAKSILQKIFPEQKDQLEKWTGAGPQKPIMLGEQVIMPEAFNKDPKARVLSIDEYRKSIQNLEQNFEGAMRNFAEAASEAGGVWDQAKHGLFGKNGEESEATKRMNNWSDRAIKIVNQLSEIYGYPPEKTIALRDSISKGLHDANASIDRGLRQFEMAAAVAVTLPLTYPAAVLVSGASSLIGTSAAFAGASAAVAASVNTAMGKGNFLCNLGKSLLEDGPQTFAMGIAFGGAIGGAFKLTPWALKARGVSSAVTGGITTTAAGTLLAGGIYHTRQDFITAKELGVLAKAARAEGKTELAHEYERMAYDVAAKGAMKVAASVVIAAAAKASGNSGSLPKKVEQKPADHHPEGPVVTIENSHFGHAVVSHKGERFSNNPGGKTRVTRQTSLPRGIHVELPPGYKMIPNPQRSLSCVNGVCKILDRAGIQSTSGLSRHIPSEFLKNILNKGLRDTNGKPIDFKIYQTGTNGPGKILTRSDLNLTTLPANAAFVLLIFGVSVDNPEPKK